MKVNDPKASAEGCWCTMVHVTTQTNISTTGGSLLFVLAFLFLLLLVGKKLEKGEGRREKGEGRREKDREEGRWGKKNGEREREMAFRVSVLKLSHHHVYKVLNYCTSKS